MVVTAKYNGNIVSDQWSKKISLEVEYSLREAVIFIEEPRIFSLKCRKKYILGNIWDFSVGVEPSSDFSFWPALTYTLVQWKH